MKETQSITEYGLFDFCRKVDELYSQGFKFSFDVNENVPTSFGSMYTAVLVQTGTEVGKEEQFSVPDTVVLPDVPAVQPKGRQKQVKA
jgi:hypothetical protein